MVNKYSKYLWKNVKSYINSFLNRNLLLITLIFYTTNFSLASEILDIRIWPSDDYTRVTIESNEILDFNSFFINNPERLVLDVKNITNISSFYNSLLDYYEHKDPYIKNIRLAKKSSDSIRIVFDLKQAIDHKTFSLEPIYSYKYRTVIDMYMRDPIMAILNKNKHKINTDTNHTNKKMEFDKNKFSSNDLLNNEKKLVIVIDPGHGGEDPGAIGENGLLEKNIVLSIAKKIKELINMQNNIEVYLTREQDYFVPLLARVQKARNVNADLLISIHADSWINKSAKGSSVFTLSSYKASSALAKWMADKENESDLIGGINLHSHDKNIVKIILDLSTTAQIKSSIKIGELLLNEIKKINLLHKNTVEQADFAILRAPDIPSVLIETAFISNPKEEILLKSEEYQQKFAEAVLKSINSYFKIDGV